MGRDRIQPIALWDVIGYLVGCLFNADTTGQTFDIGGTEILTYREMMQQYASARDLHGESFWLFRFLPLALCLLGDLMTPIPSA